MRQKGDWVRLKVLGWEHGLLGFAKITYREKLENST
jgi:hypothetical protein